MPKARKRKADTKVTTTTETTSEQGAQAEPSRSRAVAREHSRKRVRRSSTRTRAGGRRSRGREDKAADLGARSITGGDEGKHMRRGRRQRCQSVTPTPTSQQEQKKLFGGGEESDEKEDLKDDDDGYSEDEMKADDVRVRTICPTDDDDDDDDEGGEEQDDKEEDEDEEGTEEDDEVALFGHERHVSKHDTASRQDANLVHVPMLVVRLQQIATVSDDRATEVLKDVLASNPALGRDHTLWLEEAQIRLACCVELDAEASQLREAMALSLGEIEELQRVREEEDRREGLVACMRRRHPNSDVLPALSEVACLSLLITSKAQDGLNKLLNMEKKSKKWYSGRGTTLYYQRIAKDLANAFKVKLKAAMKVAGLSLQPSTGASRPQAPTISTPSREHLQPPQQQQPLLTCTKLQIMSCPLCGGGVGDNGAAQSPPQASASPSAASGALSQALAAQPVVMACFAELGDKLAAQEAHIIQEVSRMPPDVTTPSADTAVGSLVNNGNRMTYTWIPELFQVPAGDSIRDVIECCSDSD